tara:strand:- start:361 stop:756 length:396 start_codon:yes stop_codon:yes gene_type:complete
MSLEDLKGKTIHLNFSLKPKITIKKLEKDLAEMAKKKRISLATKNHRIALSRWIKSLVEDEIEYFIHKLEVGHRTGNKTPSLAKSPHDLRRRNTGAITQMVPGGMIQVSNKGKNDFYPAYNSAKTEESTED